MNWKIMQIEEDVIGRGKICKNFCHFLQLNLRRRSNPEVILPRSYISFPPSFARTFSSRERRLGTRQNGLNEIPEVRFEFPFIFIDQSTMALLRANYGAYPNPDTRGRKGGGGKGAEKGFRRRFAEGVNQSLVSSVAQASSALPKQLI